MFDHYPLVFEICIPVINKPVFKHESKVNKQQYSFRWDEGDLMLYYN